MTTEARLTKDPFPLIAELAGILKAHGAREVYLFGSRARGSAREDSDIDLAVRGLPDSVFYRAIAETMAHSELEVDVVDIDQPGPMMDLLRRKGGLIRVG